MGHLHPGCHSSSPGSFAVLLAVFLIQFLILVGTIALILTVTNRFWQRNPQGNVRKGFYTLVTSLVIFSFSPERVGL